MARPLRSYPYLSTEAAVPRQRAQLAPGTQLWIAVHLLDLALRCVIEEESPDPLAVVEPGDGRKRIVAVNEAARSWGIVSGMPLSAALARAAPLVVLDRSARIEHERLSALAAFAHGLSPIVSTERPDTLLLEVRGSLRLFGGLDAVKQKLSAELIGRGLRFNMCAAATPLAATWLARAAYTDTLEEAALPGRLGALPLAATHWPGEVCKLLAEMGVRTVGDCLRLPRDGFARRVGPAYLDALDRALGRQPDPRPASTSVPCVRRTIELSAEIAQIEALAGVLESLVASLAQELRIRQLQARELTVVFHHARSPATTTRLHLLEEAHEPRRFLEPLVARIEGACLPAPVTGLSIDAGALVAMRIDAAELFAGVEHAAAPGARAALIENLRARLGIENVYGLQLLADHRPERVWTKRIDELLGPSQRAAPSVADVGDRPLWILKSPVPVDGKVDGAALHEPERIASGWWDGDDVNRDYYIMTTRSGRRLWVYQDGATHVWYVHGIFG